MFMIKTFLTKDITFSIALIGAIIACLVGEFNVAFIDTKVILSLFGLMTAIESLKEMGTLTYLAHGMTRLAKSKRRLVQFLVALAFFASMVLTNDVTILTVLPIFLMISRQALDKRETLIGTVLIILAANLGSSAFPTGSPHNIFLYSFYHLNVATFFLWMWPFLVLSCAVLWIMSCSVSNASFVVGPRSVAVTKHHLQKHKSQGKYYLPYLSLVIMLMHVTNILHGWWWVMLAVGLVCIQLPHVIKKVDYLLLMTFVCFFLIVGNLGANHWVSDFLRQSVQSYQHTLWVSAGVSQVISNVPASILLAPFTVHAKAMIVGANIGGMGTLIASLANLIGYKVFITYYPSDKVALFKWFSAINVGLLALYLVIFSWLI